MAVRVFASLSAVLLMAVAALAAPEVDLQALPWDRLDVTWQKFTGLPITSSAAQSQGWTLLGGCHDANVPWFGNRYVLQGDLSTALIFDSNGNLAGVQAGIYQNPPKPHQFTVWENQTAFSPTGQPYWTITTYFTEPFNLCRMAVGQAIKTRFVTESQQAIGDRLTMKLGSSPNFMDLPLNEADAPAAGWVKGKCFISMGQHYWFNISEGMTCDDFFPLFIIYNKGILTTYGFDTGIGEAQNQASSRWEHPGGKALDLFFQPGSMAQCIWNVGNLSTQHVFLTNPLFDWC